MRHGFLIIYYPKAASHKGSLYFRSKKFFHNAISGGYRVQAKIAVSVMAKNSRGQ